MYYEVKITVQLVKTNALSGAKYIYMSIIYKIMYIYAYAYEQVSFEEIKIQLINQNTCISHKKLKLPSYKRKPETHIYI